jgi:hypothetical protein
VRLESLAKKLPLSTSLRILKRLASLDERTIDCHILAHTLMRQYVKDNPTKWGEFLKEIDPYGCNWGFFHGIIETKSLVDKSFRINATSIPRLCDEFQAVVKGANLDQTCSHIMGHLLLIEENASIPDALAVCNKTPSHMHRECFAGIFMENYTRDNIVAHGLGEMIPWTDERVSQLEGICQSVPDEEAFSCWQEMAHLYTARTPEKPEKVYAQCQKAEKKSFVDSCYIHAVNSLAQAKGADKPYLSRLCMPYKDDQLSYSSCLNTVIRSLIYSNLDLTKRALLLCDASPDADRMTCYSILTDALKKRGDTKKAITWCREIPKNYQEFCKRLTP